MTAPALATMHTSNQALLRPKIVSVGTAVPPHSYTQ
ncbi:MAG: hypothetical protein QOE51_140, partial [Actinoplanes sp.]|nr:hypothetical protein [Actinoplanes sp.]